jgi:8-oxo-dGTP pyrophosphatase MutT (NUDIX family)
VDPGESDEEAARRELAEETGLAIASLQPLLVEHLPGAPPHPAFRLQVFRGYDPSGTLQAADDAEAAAWFGIEEMLRLPVIPSVLAAAQAIVAEESAGGEPA